MPLSRRKRIVFALLAIALAIGVPFTLALAADLYLHHRAERFAGVNIWGYRGPIVGRKRAGEHRLVVLGGSTAFGYGVVWTEAFPAKLEADLRPLSRGAAPVSVVNLGMNDEGAASFRETLEDYRSLDYDAAVLYEGYNDLAGDEAPNGYNGRRASPVFRLTGYYPIAPVFLREKAMVIRAGGDLNAAYRGDKTVFRPNLASRTSAAALDTAADVGQSLARQLGRFSRESTSSADRAVAAIDPNCTPNWNHYCAAVRDAIAFALAHGRKVLVVTQPYIDDRHRRQQEALHAMLHATFGGNPGVATANLGALIDLFDEKLCYDRMHLTAEGNAIVAQHLVEPIAALMPEAFERPATASIRGGGAR